MMYLVSTGLLVNLGRCSPLLCDVTLLADSVCSMAPHSNLLPPARDQGSASYLFLTLLQASLNQSSPSL